METIEMLINELESNLLKAKRSMFSSTDVVVNRAVVLDIVSRIRTNYPAALREAAQIKQNEEKIIRQAEADADNILRQANEQAQQMVASSEITRRAQAQAQNLNDQVNDQCRQMDYDTRKFAFGLLNNVEASMRDSLKMIAEQKDKLLNQ